MIKEIKEADEIINEMNNINEEEVERLRARLENTTSSISEIRVQSSHRPHSREDALLLLADITMTFENGKDKLNKLYHQIEDRDLKIYFDKRYFHLNNAQLIEKWGLTKQQINRIVKKIQEKHQMFP